MLYFLLACSLSMSISSEQAQFIGSKIYHNECSSKPSLLISWNQGEEFLSLGIGHFIWYPEGKSGPFEAQFPAFIASCLEQKVPVPTWLQKKFSHCPWSSKEAFQNQIGKPQVEQLREFLLKTQDLQAIFIVRRLEESLPKITQGCANPQKITSQFQRVASRSEGLYALVDYANFKGTGTAITERYNGKGWGLLQVLEEMETTNNALDDFSNAAKKVLIRRVGNAPKERNEERWLQGWINRINSYNLKIS